MAKKTSAERTAAEPDPGPAWFQKMFKRIGHRDDWGVTCVYDYAAWRLCKAAMRRQRLKMKAPPTAGEKHE